MTPAASCSQIPYLKRPCATLKGIGRVRRAALAAAGIETVADLLVNWPRRHEFLPAPTPLTHGDPGDTLTLIGQILKSTKIRSRRHLGGHLKLLVDVDNSQLVLNFFNQGFLDKKLRVGLGLVFSGRLEVGPPLSMNPVYYRIAEDAPTSETILPVYCPVAGIKPGMLSRIMAGLVADVELEVIDPLPQSLRRHRNLLSLKETLREMHAPTSLKQLAAAEKRLVYNAFLCGAFRCHSAVGARATQRATGVSRDLALEEKLLDSLPFTLTKGQAQALEDVFDDMRAERPMCRLIQGDVGCGKTAVACLAALAVALRGRQVAILAPTAVLARQFHKVLTTFGDPFGIDVGLLLGTQSSAVKKDVLTRAQAGLLKIVVGSHAIFQTKVVFADLSLVVVDEQHRFGVMQRLQLVRKGLGPHLLAMSATPIPRSLSMTLYSDLNLSAIKERPPGREDVATYHHVVDRDGPFPWIKLATAVRAGAKAFVVFPAIDSEQASCPSLLREGRQIATSYFKGLKVAALHGQMEEEEKQRNLEAFRKGEVQVLFATTVIEVGVDVPDASRIVVVGAGRFGLAQLHQLRGRVGRGGLAGRCDLLTKDKKSAESEKLGILVDCADGFALAEHDLQMRGPGDVLGLKQHGVALSTFSVDEERSLLEAFEDARTMVEEGFDDNQIESLALFSRRKRGRSREFMDAG